MKINQTQVQTLTHTLPSGIEVELELGFTPDSIMEYKDELVHQVGNKVLLGYLAHDSDCANPLEDYDCMGYIYTARRGSSNLSDFFEALGLDSGGDRDLDLIDDEDCEEECIRRLKLMAECKWEGPNQALRIDGDFDDQEREEDETMIEFVLRLIDEGHVDLEDYFDFDTIREYLWEKGRQDGSIGNKYAVSLDVYEHGLVKYSVAGTGPQCRFDTARGGAVWVPDDCCVEEIKRRGPVYQKGAITKSNLRTKQQYNVRTYEKFGVFDQVVHPPFETWGEAFTYLENLSTLSFIQTLDDGEYDAARELAGQAAEQYTDWCNGNCFGWVVATYVIPEGVEEGATIEPESSDECWGYVGDDHAYSSLQEEFDARKQSL